MTRKQALQAALAVLREDRSTCAAEAADKLQELMGELPLTSWTAEVILDTLEQFSIDNGRNPTVADLKKKGLPPHTVIKLRFGVTAKAFLARRFPSAPAKTGASPYAFNTGAAWAEDFVRQYRRIKPASRRDYDERREKGTPSAQTVAKYLGQTGWAALLKHLELSVYRGGRALGVTHVLRIDGRSYASLDADDVIDAPASD